MVTYATQSTKRFQWESSSLYSQAYNCGPTCVAFIIGYYLGWRGIEARRSSIAGWGPYNVSGVGTVYGAPARTPTTAWQQRDMLIRGGVGASVRTLNGLTELHSLVDSNRRPLILGIQMSRVPANFRDHSFLGWHAVVVMSGGWRDGTHGFWVNDPNFAPGQDPDGGMKWYPDWVMQQAWANNSPRYAVVPTNPKPLPVTAPTSSKGRGRIAGPDCNIRTSMSSASSTNIYARSNADGWTYRLKDGARLWSNASNFIFFGFVGTGSMWASVKTGSGQQLYIYRTVFKVTIAP